MLLPLALTLARQEDGRGVFRRWFPVVAMTAVIPLPLSPHSALVGAVVRARSSGAHVAEDRATVADRRGRRGGGSGCSSWFPASSAPFLGSSPASAATAAHFRVPTAMGIVLQYFQQRPIFGRGFSTFLPAYRILDNQFLGLLVDIGIVGLVSFPVTAERRNSRRLVGAPGIRLHPRLVSLRTA